MRRIPVLCLLAIFVAACSGDRQPRAPRVTKLPPKVKHSDMQTIDDVAPHPGVLDPPPVLRDEAPPPKPVVAPWETAAEPVKLTPEDEKVRAALPFTPAIALDAVDGEKISILATTPTFEYKGRVFYFASEENKRLFMANPDQYAKSAFAHL
ncbi:MAG TPA: YHS domain-containing protein [Thermoanaerobaculia bacterium]|nr:YHS domain-containing protein [Thermoanaerobaculia bacterium]